MCSSSKILCSHFRDTAYLKFRAVCLPEHGTEQAFFCSGDPLHCAPPLIGVGAVHERVRLWNPFPQRAEQPEDHSDHCDHPPSTESRNKSSSGNVTPSPIRTLWTLELPYRNNTFESAVSQRTDDKIPPRNFLCPTKIRERFIIRVRSVCLSVGRRRVAMGRREGGADCRVTLGAGLACGVHSSESNNVHQFVSSFPGGANEQTGNYNPPSPLFPYSSSAE